MRRRARAEECARKHPRTSLDVTVASPRLLVRASPEDDSGTCLVLEPGNMAVASFYEGEVVVLGVSPKLRLPDSDEAMVWRKRFQTDLAQALGVPTADVCHVRLSDA